MVADAEIAYQHVGVDVVKPHGTEGADCDFAQATTRNQAEALRQQIQAQVFRDAQVGKQRQILVYDLNAATDGFDGC